MNYKIITCECGNTYSKDIWEGKCCVCGKILEEHREQLEEKAELIDTLRLYLKMSYYQRYDCNIELFKYDNYFDIKILEKHTGKKIEELLK